MPGPLVLPVPPDVLLYARPKLEVGADDLIEDEPDAKDALDLEVSRTGLFVFADLSFREKRPILNDWYDLPSTCCSDLGNQRLHRDMARG